MRHASLFSGIGGFDLAAEWMGWENVFSCEYDSFCQTVLRHHFPSTIHYGDIRQLDGTQFRGRIDVLTGGFPCQPFSAAGQRRGTDDNRFLWPEMLRVIREVQPTWIVAENVRGILSIENGLVFERVCSEMEEAGYEVQPICIPACSVGAPHKRERIWFVGHAKHDGLLTSKDREGCSERSDNHSPRQDELRELEGSTLSRSSADNRRERRDEGAGKAVRSEGEEPKHEDCDNTNSHNAPDSNYTGLEGRKESRRDSEDRKEPHDKYLGRRSSWDEPWIQAATRLCRVDDGLPRGLDGITVPKWRRESIKAYGNAIVPAIALRIFEAISQAENAQV